MAEPNKNIQEPQTGTGSTVPVSSVSEPVEMQTQEVATPQVVDWPNLQEEQVLRERNAQVLQEPVTPEVVEPTQVPKTSDLNKKMQEFSEWKKLNEFWEEIEAPSQKRVDEFNKKFSTTLEAPKQPVWKIETAQDIKTQEIANEDLTNELNEKKKSQVMQEFQNMVQSGATIEEIGEFGLQNKQFARDINNVLRTNFKNTENTKYFWKYSTMSNQEMYEAYKNWDVVLWSEKFNLLPEEKKASFNQYVDQRRIANSLTKTDFTSSAKSTDLSNLESQIPKMFDSNVRKKYEEKLNNPRIGELKSQLTTNQFDIEDLDDKIANLEDDILKASPWISSVILWSEVRTRTRELLKEKTQLLRQRQLYLSEYDGLKSDAEIELKLSMYEDERARQDYQTKLSLYETRRKETLSRTQTLEDRDFALRVENERREFEQKNKEIAAQKAFEQQKELLKYKNDIEQGNIKWQWANRFDWLYFLDDKWNATKIIDWGFETQSDWTSTFIRTDENGNPVVEVYDITWNPIWANTNTSRFTQEQVDLLNAPAWSVIPTRLSEVSKNNVNRGKECAEYINDIFGKNIWAKMGSSYESKLKVANEKNGWLWSIAVWQPNPWDKYYSQFWHAWVIVWESEDGTKWHIKSSNFSWDGTISVDEVPKNVIAWYKTTSLYEQPIEEKTYTSAQKKYLETVDLQSFNDKKEVKAAAESLWLTAEDVFAYKGNNIDPMKKTELQDVLDWIDALLKAWDWDGLSDALWPISALNPLKYLPWTDAADFEAQFESLSGKLTLPNLEKMSWVLSDTDIKILQWASSALSLSMSEKEFKKELNRIKTSAQNSLDKLGALDNNFFTDSSGKKWSKQWLADELANLIESWKMTQEQAQDFIQKNNLNFN